MEKCGRAGQGTDDNMAHAHCMLDNCDYRHTLRIYNNCCFSTAIMVTRTRLVTSWYSVCVLLSVGISEVYFFATEVSGVHNLHHQYIMELR